MPFLEASNKTGKEHDIVRFGILATQLPNGSRTMSQMSSKVAWNDSTKLLSYIEYDIRCLLYAFIDKKNMPDKAPEPIQPLNKEDREKRIKGNKKMEIDGEKIEPVSRDELKEIFGH